MTVASGWVDSHAHLEDEKLRRDLVGVLGRAAAAGVLQVVAVGTTADDSAGVQSLAVRIPGVFATVGVHPNHAAEAAPGDWDRVVGLADQPGVVAIGETGLDRHWDFTPFAVQLDWFDRHLELAERKGLPLVIHCRNCESDIVASLERRGRATHGVLHSFTGNAEQAAAFLELGLHLSFAGMLTFANKKLDGLREVAANVPGDRLLIETDSPYLSPEPFRGRTNEPARVIHTASKLAEVRGTTPEAIKTLTTGNARRLFGLPETWTLAP